MVIVSCQHGMGLHYTIFYLRVIECTIVSLQNQSIQVKDAEAIAFWHYEKRMYKERKKQAHMVTHSVDVLEQLAASIFRLIQRDVQV